MNTALKKIGVPVSKDESLFSGLWIRWSNLNAAERLVCAIIVLMPLWWALGIIPYLLDFTMLGMVAYEWRSSGKLRLKSPSLLVIALFAYYAYEYANGFLLYFDAHPLAVLPPDTAKKPFDLLQGAVSAVALPYLIWYIQSNNVKVRPQVVAWAFSVSVVQMLAVWFVAHFVFSEPYYNPPRTLWAVLTNKTTSYTRGIGDTNYLLLYWPTDVAIGGLPRHYSFFYRPETLALFVGLVGILALEIKNRLWSVPLFAASLLLIGLSGTRTIWLAFPVVVLVHFLLAFSKASGTRFLFALIATMSFLTLSVPPITNAVFSTYNDAATYISDFRENSTEHRGAAYEGTLERILDAPDTFVFGHIVSGPNAVGTEVEIGSHSFLIGSLLYKGGFISTVLFLTFWTSLMMWLYRTRAGRPISCFSIVLLLSLTFVTTLLGHVTPMAILLSMVLRQPVRQPVIKSFSRNAFYA